MSSTTRWFPANLAALDEHFPDHFELFEEGSLSLPPPTLWVRNQVERRNPGRPMVRVILSLQGNPKSVPTLQ